MSPNLKMQQIKNLKKKQVLALFSVFGEDFFIKIHPQRFGALLHFHYIENWFLFVPKKHAAIGAKNLCWVRYLLIFDEL